MNHSSSRLPNDLTLDPDERLAMAYWGLPELVRARYAHKGITNMFEWQAECLGCGGALEGEKLRSVRYWVN